MDNGDYLEGVTLTTFTKGTKMKNLLFTIFISATTLACSGNTENPPDFTPDVSNDDVYEDSGYNQDSGIDSSDAYEADADIGVELDSFETDTSDVINVDAQDAIDSGVDSDTQELVSFICPDAFWFASGFEPVSSRGPLIQYDLDRAVDVNTVSGQEYYHINEENSDIFVTNGNIYEDFDYFFGTECFNAYLMYISETDFERVNLDIITTSNELPGCRRNCQDEEDVEMFDNPIRGTYYFHAFRHTSQFDNLISQIDGCDNLSECTSFCRDNDSNECSDFVEFRDTVFAANFPIDAYRYICGVSGLGQRGCTF
jgi:hypothetical protein